MPPYADTNFVPPNSETQIAARRYAEYRTRLDEQMYRRGEAERVIDVTARRVEFEEPQQEPAPPLGEEGEATAANQENTSQRSRRAERESETTSRPFIYRPAEGAPAIEVRSSPLARGSLIDLMA
jgi:hypothetical protein